MTKLYRIIRIAPDPAAVVNVRHAERDHAWLAYTERAAAVVDRQRLEAAYPEEQFVVVGYVELEC